MKSQNLIVKNKNNTKGKRKKKCSLFFLFIFNVLVFHFDFFFTLLMLLFLNSKGLKILNVTFSQNQKVKKIKMKEQKLHGKKQK